MCLRAVGAELPLMEGTRPWVCLHVFYDDTCICKQAMRRDHLPVRRYLDPSMRQLLEQDKRKRGEHRPRRLTLGRFNPWPYTLYSMRLPGHGLYFPDGDLTHLRLQLWVELYDPMFPHQVLFHLKASEPRQRANGSVRWSATSAWTPMHRFGPLQQVHEETPCGCGVRVSVRYAGPEALECTEWTKTGH